MNTDYHQNILRKMRLFSRKNLTNMINTITRFRFQRKKSQLKVGEIKTKVNNNFLIGAIVLFLGLNFILFNTNNKDEKVNTNVASVEEKQEKEYSEYELFMWMIKSKESFQPYEYTCPAGFLTIGFGYNIDAHGYEPIKNYLNNGKISYEGATKILVSQVETVMKELVTKDKLTHLNVNQQRAVASLILNCGKEKIKYRFGKKKLGKSDFWRSLEKGETPNFVKYNKYKTPSGKIKTSPALTKARKFEQALFTGDKNTVKKIGLEAKQIVISRDLKKAK